MSKDINVISQSGRLVKDAIFRQVGNGLIEYDIAVGGSKKENGQWIDTVSYFKCIYWCKTDITQYLKKGRQILQSGEMIQENYIDKNGEKKYIYKIRIESIVFVNEAKNNNQNNPDNGFPQ